MCDTVFAPPGIFAQSGVQLFCDNSLKNHRKHVNLVPSFLQLSCGHFGHKFIVYRFTNRQINRLKVGNVNFGNRTKVHVLKNLDMRSCSDHVTPLGKVVGNCLGIILVPEFLSFLHI